MDFYTHQSAARRQTRWLVVAFIVAVVLVVLALDIVLFSLFGSGEEQQALFTPIDFALRHPGPALFCTLIALGVIGLSSLFKSYQLRDGGGVVATSLGGVRVERDTGDFKRKRLHNIVEEMAIASGVPMPEIYVLDHENGINAFAAGHTPANAAVAVTHGALEKLNREQLQGVIAHEFSHILNGDMRLNIQLMGWLYGLFVVGLIGRTLLRWAPRGRKGAAGLLGVGLAVTVLGYFGLLAGRILQAAVSRQRERLADASAVQFTRNPLGLKDALIKIAGFGAGSKMSSANTEQVAHMLFASGIKRAFATHPPIEERIKLLDPRFNLKDLPRLAAEASVDVPDAEEIASARSVVSNLAPASVSAREIATQVGRPQTIHVQHARELRLQLPESLREFVESSGKARSMVLALLLSQDEFVRKKQLRLIALAVPVGEIAWIEEITPVVRDLEPFLRLPALLQIFPVLRRLPLDERRVLAELAEQLIHADARIDVFEFCLSKLLSTLLTDEIEALAPHGRKSLADAMQAIHVVFAVLARSGAADELQARRAYEAGMQLVFPMRRPEYISYEDWPARLDKAISTLEQLQPFAKQAVVEGLARAVAHDDMLSVSEAELLRTVCAAIHCPLPPLLA